ncbi:D-galactarolactone cycloisomerase [Hoeflea marina]|uniref:D-galactarolactone cycloisomerase n=1 Tax=Hoeflea marina TaxID=274592 RepID=A0A317PLL2_9HYPH|nr:mandelate racemase/muconate lactonizing enzyme family protein [Hoeflea marina]PWV99926.1 D-galactarolactone cycloisomerase [Hoeflea marina]
MPDAADRIVRIEGFELGCDMPETAGNALRSFSRRETLFVRVTTAGGISGWGETWAFPAPAAAFIRTVLARVVLGASIDNPRRLHADMLRLVVPERRGLALMAVSAIDMAVWDALGRAGNRPIHALLGGALRDALPAYASGPLLPVGGDRYRDFRSAVESYVDSGFRAVKIRIGVGLARDEAAIRAAREILGADRMLMADLNEASTVRSTLALLDNVRDVGLGWIEEPVRHDDLPAWRDLAARVSVPLAGGESFCGAQAFRDAIGERTLDIVQPDIALCGGFTEVQRVCGLADAFGIPVIPHVWGGGVNFLASIQLAATLTEPAGAPALPMLEYDMSHNPLRAALYDPLPDAAGMVAIPDGPGLGIEIDAERLAGYVSGHWVLE